MTGKYCSAVDYLAPHQTLLDHVNGCNVCTVCGCVLDDDVGGVQFYSYGVGVGVVFTISHTAVTCWVCSPSPVLQSNSRIMQKLEVVALPYTSMLTQSNVQQ